MINSWLYMLCNIRSFNHKSTPQLSLILWYRSPRSYKHTWNNTMACLKTSRIYRGRRRTWDWSSYSYAPCATGCLWESAFRSCSFSSRWRFRWIQWAMQQEGWYLLRILGHCIPWREYFGLRSEWLCWFKGRCLVKIKPSCSIWKHLAAFFWNIPNTE